MAERINAVKTSFFGKGAIRLLGPELQKMGIRRALLVTDRFLYDSGAAARVGQVLSDAGVEYAVYYNVQPNPTVQVVNDCIAAARTLQVQLLVALGGGSAIDTAKAASIVVACGGTVEQYEGENKSSKPGLPIVAVNTTAGTASEMTRFCIITDTSRKVKMAIVDWRCTPSVAIDDPLLMMGMPPALTAATGMDALTHAVEAYVSTAATPMTDACAEKAIEYINRYLRRAVANGRDKEAREGMCYAQYLAGMAFNNASLGHVHAMAHQLGGFYDLPHGECNAILLPHVSQYNLISSRRRFGRIARLLGERTEGLSPTDASQKAITAITILSKDVGIPDGLIALGKKYGKDVREEDIPTMTANAQKDACGLTNPRMMTDAAVAAIYKAAL